MTNVRQIRLGGGQEAVLQQGHHREPLLRISGTAPRIHHDRNHPATVLQCLGKRVDDGGHQPLERRRVAQGREHRAFESSHQFLPDRVDQLFFALESPIDAADRHAGVLGHPGDGELVHSAIDQDILRRSE